MTNKMQSEKNEIAARIFDTFSFLYLFPFSLSEKKPQKKNDMIVISAIMINTPSDIAKTLFITSTSF